MTISGCCGGHTVSARERVVWECVGVADREDELRAMKVLLREIHRVPVHVQRERLQPHAMPLHNSVVRLDNAS